MASLGDVTVELDLDIDNFRRNLSRMRSQLDGMSRQVRQGANRSFGGFSDIVNNLGGGLGNLKNMFAGGLAMGGALIAVQALQKAFVALGQAIKNTIIEGIAYNASLEQNTIAFEVMLGSMKEAKVLMKDIQSFADITPFSTEGLVQSAKILKQFGLETEKIMPTLQSIGDIALGNEEKMKGLALVFSQIRSTGKLMQQDLNQLINNGFNPLQEIAKRTGKDFNELNRQFRNSEIEISADAIALAFKSARSEGGQFFKGMDKLGKSFNGQMSTLKDTMAKLKGQLMKPFMELLSSNVLPKLIEFLKAAIVVTIKWQKTMSKFAKIWVTLYNMMKEAVMPILVMIKRLNNLVRDSFVNMKNVITGNWLTAFKNTENITKNFKNIFKDTMKAMGRVAYDWAVAFVEVFKSMGIDIEKIFIAILQSLINKYNSFIEKVNKVKLNVPAIKTIWGKELVPEMRIGFNLPKLTKDASEYTEEWKKGLKTFLGVNDAFKNMENTQNNNNKSVSDGIDWASLFGKEMNLAGKDAKALNKVMEDLTKTIKDQAKSFANFVDVFGKVKKVRVSAKSLFYRLKGQVKEMEKWQNAVMELKRRLGADSALFQEIVKKGPAAAGETMAVAGMSDEMLAEYQNLFDQKIDKAVDTALATNPMTANMKGVSGGGITVNITGNNINDSMDVDIIANKIANKLKLVGVQ